MAETQHSQQFQWTLDQIQKWTHGKLISKHLTEFSKVGTDTRKNLTHQIFIALKGDQFDAHDYLDQAVLAGAGLLIVDRIDEKFQNLKNEVSILLVKNSLKALQDFATEYRQTLNVKIIGITGSNGKTTTKEMTSTLLSQLNKTHFSHGSFNNHWGVPLTLLGMNSDHRFAVIEMGMNHFGEIQRLVEIARPHIVVCTMVGTAHIEFFGSIQKIAQAKNEIYEFSDETTVRIFNQDQDLTFDMMYPSAKKFPAGRMLSFSEKNIHADVFFRLDEINEKGLSISGSIAGIPGLAHVPILGKHNVVNLMAASTIAYASGMSPELIWNSLKLCKSNWGRNEIIYTQNKMTLLFDGYNANIDSMKALLDTVSSLSLKSRKIAVFGQMRELGELSNQLHFELGQLVAREKYDKVFFIGENYQDFYKGFMEISLVEFANCDTELTDNLKNIFLETLQPNDFILIKGSRGIRTERFVQLCEPLHWKNKQ